MSTQKIILAAVLAVLLIGNILNLWQLKSLKEQLAYFQSEVEGISDSVSSISYNVNESMESFLREQSWVIKKDYQVIKTNYADNTIEVKLECTFRELSDGEEVTFLVRGRETDEWLELKAEHDSGMNYSVVHTFPMAGNFETQIFARSGNEQRSEEFLQLNFRDDLDRRMEIHAWYEDRKNNKVNLFVNISNHLKHKFIGEKNKDGFRIKTAKAVISSEGKVLEEFDLLKGNEVFESSADRESIYFEKQLKVEYDDWVDFESCELIITVEDHLGLKYQWKAILYEIAE